MISNFEKVTTKRLLKAAFLPIFWNLLVGFLFVAFVIYFGTPIESVDYLDFGIEFLSAVASFFLYVVACFFAISPALKRNLLIGLFLFQLGRTFDAVDELVIIESLSQWSTIGDVFTLVGEGGIAFTAFRYILASNARAYTDPLTDLFNRRYHEEELKKLLRYGAGDALHFSVIALDLDNFKVINDTKGHAAGDEALRHTASILKSCSRANDVVSRVGGEEFEVLAPGVGKDLAIAIAERIRSSLEANPPKGLEQLTASLGVATFEAGDSMEALRHRADQAVYTSKTTGKNTVSFQPR